MENERLNKEVKGYVQSGIENKSDRVAAWHVWLAAVAMLFLGGINFAVMKHHSSDATLPVENDYQLSVIHTY